ncbi:MAG TPA: class D sortase, partial [Thermoanaerobaculia bacterium]
CGMSGERKGRGGPQLALERALMGAGLVFLTIWGVVRFHGEVGRQAELQRFADARAAAIANTGAFDGSLWSPKRIRAYRETLTKKFPPPLAVLRIPRARVEVPVLQGTDAASLNRGVGWIAGTARPGEAGNVGIAGHRDGFFRGLKDIAAGDALELETTAGREKYAVADIRIVDPKEVSVLRPTSEDTVTLVTCYPFYFVGDAPRRYIVRAVRQTPSAEKRASR